MEKLYVSSVSDPFLSLYMLNSSSLRTSYMFHGYNISPVIIAQSMSVGAHSACFTFLTTHVYLSGSFWPIHVA